MEAGVILVGALSTLVVGVLLHTYQHWLETGSIRPIDSSPNANDASRAIESADRRDRYIGTFISMLQAGILVLAGGRIQLEFNSDAPITRWTIAATAVLMVWLVMALEKAIERLTKTAPAERRARQKQLDELARAEARLAEVTAGLREIAERPRPGPGGQKVGGDVEPAGTELPKHAPEVNGD